MSVREAIADLALDHALQRTRAERGIEALLGDLVRRGRGDDECDASRRQPVAQAVDLDRHDLG